MDYVRRIIYVVGSGREGVYEKVKILTTGKTLFGRRNFLTLADFLRLPENELDIGHILF